MYFSRLNRAILSQSSESVFADAGSESGFTTRKLPEMKEAVIFTPPGQLVSWDSFMENVRRDARDEVFQRSLSKTRRRFYS